MNSQKLPLYHRNSMLLKPAVAKPIVVLAWLVLPIEIALVVLSVLHH